MSHHNYSNHHGRPSHTGTNSHSGSLYPEPGRTILPPLTIAFPTSDSPVYNPNYITAQRSTPVLYGAPYFPPAQEQQRNAPRPTYPSCGLQNATVPPAPANGEPEGHREDIPPPFRGVAEPGRVQEPLHADVAYQGVGNYQPHALVGNPVYVFPDIEPAQGIPAQAQPNDPVDIERNLGYIPQHNAPGPVQATFPHPFVHRIPTPNQAGAENLRLLAVRYLHHTDAQVGMVSVEAGTAGRFKVVIILESHDVF